MLAFEPITKARGEARRRQSERRVVTRATPLATNIERLLRAHGQELYAREMRRLRRNGRFVKDGIGRRDLELELVSLLQRYGIAQVSDAGVRVGGSRDIAPEIMSEVLRSKPNRVVLLIEETEAMARESMRQILEDASREVPRPSFAEIGRRISRSWFGPTSRQNPGRSTRAEDRMTADWRRRDRGGPRPGEQEYLFSFDRAATIARTELAQGENQGIAAGVIDAGFEKLGWVSRPNDGKSGARMHWRMNDHPPIFVEAIVKQDRSGWFVLPSGDRAPYPAWSGLPIGQSINCRCFGRGV